MRSFVHSDMRGMNRQTVYQLLSSMDDISKADIVRITGISAPTITKIVSFFLDNGLAYECGEKDNGIGRKPQMLRFNPGAYHSIGVMVEGQFLKMAVVDLHGKVLHMDRVMLPARDFPEMLKSDVLPAVESFYRSAPHIRAGRVLGIGIGLPVVLDNESKAILQAPQFGITKPTCFKELFDRCEQRLEVPVIIENGVNAAAIGECVSRGLGSDAELIYISLGMGLRAGIVLDGKLRRGHKHFAGEIGYAVFDEDYVYDEEQTGWFESRVNLSFICQHFGLDMGDIYQAFRGESERLLARKADIISYLAPKLGLAIVNFPLQLDVELVVLGGLLPELLGQEFVDAINERIRRASGERVNVQYQRGANSGVVGAAALVTTEQINEVLAGNP